MNSRSGQVVVDVGGGRSCPFAKYRDPAAQTKIIAVDVLEEELRQNEDVDERRAANITQGLPFEADEIDLLVSRWVLEHLESTDNFFESSEVALKREGYSIHLFASRFAPFALINQALPDILVDKVNDFFLSRGSKSGRRRFPAVYDHCYYSGIEKLLENHGFEMVDVHLNYYQARYFSFFFPLFLANALYEMLILALGAKNLAAHILVIARKK